MQAHKPGEIRTDCERVFIDTGLHMYDLCACRSPQHKRAALQQQKADWNTVKKHVPNAINEVMDAESEMMTTFFKFVSRA